MGKYFCNNCIFSIKMIKINRNCHKKKSMVNNQIYPLELLQKGINNLFQDDKLWFNEIIQVQKLIYLLRIIGFKIDISNLREIAVIVQYE